MKKIDWIEYFEAVNGRAPEEAEILAALEAGEFEEETISESANEPIAKSVTEQSGTEQVKETSSSPVQTKPVEGINSNPQVQEWKAKGNDYFNWVVQALKKPNNSNKPNFIYSAVTVALSATLLAAAIVFYIRNVVLSFINTSVGGVTIQSTSPEVYDKLVLEIEGGFGLGAVLKFGLAILVFYSVAIILPGLFSKFIQKTELDIKTEFAKASQFTPILLVLNAIGFISTLFVKKSLIVSSEIQSDLTNLLSTITSNPMQTATDFMDLVNRVPAIDSVVKVFICISLVSLLGSIFIFVAIAKNTKLSYKKIDNFYVTTALIFIVMLGLYYLNHLIGSEITTIFKGIYANLTSSY
ncbi:TPA: hypothetical protein U2D04_000718 [Streptococcus suis]|nr:hypothetical protein [Streptococcus suis]HEM6339133.1 hypothetical protein [Streptococcus suis]